MPGEGEAQGHAFKSQPTSSEDGGSGGEGHSGGDSTDDDFVYDGVGVRDSLDDLNGTLQKTQEHRQRYQAQLRAFNAKGANRQGSVIKDKSGGVFAAPCGGGGGSGGRYFANNTVGGGNEPAPTSPSS